MCITALVIASEWTMSAGVPEVRAPQSKQMTTFSKTSCKNKDCMKEVGRTMTANSRKGALVHYPDLPSEYRLPRPVEVWLPESYDPNSGDRYPVLYMHDGQFLFNRGETPFLGTDYLWDVDTTMARLIENGEIRPAIVVSIWANLDTKSKRKLEFMPEKPVTDYVWKLMNAREPVDPGEKIVSDNYLKFLVNELKPFIDKTYRTQPDRESTFVVGSSMGGMISAYAISEYPDIFGGAACLSTHWVLGDGAVIAWYKDHWPDAGVHRIYFDHGTETLDAEYEPYQLKMDEVMQNKGYRSGEDWISRRFDGADHSPRAWRERLHIPLVFLLGNR
jgi:enterochelin esterase-like enzyme